MCRSVLRYDVRPEQKREILALADEGVVVGLLVGIKGTHDLIFMPPKPKFLHGELSFNDQDWVPDCYHVTRMNERSFGAGVNFIFLNSSKTEAK